MSLKGTVLVLQILAGLLIALGVGGVISHTLAPRMVSILGVVLPSSILAFSVVGVGVYYWLRASRLKQKVARGSLQ